jgi:hypothetical protein
MPKTGKKEHTVAASAASPPISPPPPPIITTVLENPKEIIDRAKYTTENSAQISVRSTFGGLQMAQNIIFDSLIQVLNKYKQGQHKGVRWLGCMNTKEDVEIVKKFLDLGMQIRHTKDIPLNFSITDREFNFRVDKMENGKVCSSVLSSPGSGNLPSVSFLKAAAYQDGHAGYSDPLDEQHFLVDTINRLQKLAEWNSTAVIITYDDSDGWYDHVMPPIVSQSNDPRYDRLLGKDGLCGLAPTGAYQDRCGYGPRLPFLIISPYAKVNYVDHSVTDQTSIIRFIEDNWDLGRIGNQSFDVKAGSILNMFNSTTNHHAPKLFLDNSTGLEK